MGCEAPKNQIEVAIFESINQDILDAVTEGTRQDLGQEQERQANEHILESIRFLDYFNISGSSAQIVHEVRSIQGRLGVQVDGEVGPGTLTQVYIQEYFENYDSLGTLQKWRYQAYLQVGPSYPDWSRYVFEKESVVTLRTGTRNVFNKGYYFEIQNENLWVDDLLIQL